MAASSWYAVINACWEESSKRNCDWEQNGTDKAAGGFGWEPGWHNDAWSHGFVGTIVVPSLLFAEALLRTFYYESVIMYSPSAGALRFGQSAITVSSSRVGVEL